MGLGIHWTILAISDAMLSGVWTDFIPVESHLLLTVELSNNNDQYCASEGTFQTGSLAVGGSRATRPSPSANPNQRCRHNS